MIAALGAIALCFSLISGATYSLARASQDDEFEDARIVGPWITNQSDFYADFFVVKPLRIEDIGISHECDE
jgi:hypothetical protein